MLAGLAPPPCFLLGGCPVSAPLWASVSSRGVTGRLRRGGSLPQLPQASRPPRGLARCEAQGCVSLPDGFCGGQRGASAGWGYRGGRSSQEFPSVTHRYESPGSLAPLVGQLLFSTGSCVPQRDGA